MASSTEVQGFEGVVINWRFGGLDLNREDNKAREVKPTIGGSNFVISYSPFSVKDYLSGTFTM